MKYLSSSNFIKVFFPLLGTSSLVFAMDFDDIEIKNLKSRKGEIVLTIDKMYEQRGVTSNIKEFYPNSVKIYINDLFQNLEKKDGLYKNKVQENELKDKEIYKKVQENNQIYSLYNENLLSTEREKNEWKIKETKLQKENDLLIDKIDQKKTENEKMSEKLSSVNDQVRVLAIERENLKEELSKQELKSRELITNLSNEKDSIQEALNKYDRENQDLQSKVNLLKKETEKYQTLIKVGEKSLNDYLLNEENKRKEIEKLMENGKLLIHELREENETLKTEKKELIEQRSHAKEIHVPLKDFQEIKEALMKVEQEKFDLEKKLILKGEDSSSLKIASHEEQSYVRSLKRMMGKAGIKYSKENDPKTLTEAFAIVNNFFEEEDF